MIDASTCGNVEKSRASAIGLTVVFGVLIGGSVGGGSMTPARSLGPAFLAGPHALVCYRVYRLGPSIGAVTAALPNEAIRGDSAFTKNAPESDGMSPEFEFAPVSTKVE